MSAGSEHRKCLSSKELDTLLVLTSVVMEYSADQSSTRNSLVLSRTHWAALSRKNIVYSFIATKFGDSCQGSCTVFMTEDLYDKGKSYFPEGQA